MREALLKAFVEQEVEVPIEAPTPTAKPLPQPSKNKKKKQKRSKHHESVVLMKVRALYEHVPEEENELYFDVGEIIQVTRVHKSGWSKGFIADEKRKGVFPMSYTEKVEEEDADQNQKEEGGEEQEEEEGWEEEDGWEEE